MTYEVPVVQVSRSAGGRRVLAVAGVLAIVVLIAAIARLVGEAPSVAVSAPDADNAVVEVRMRGDSVDVYIDGQYLKTITDRPACVIVSTRAVSTSSPAASSSRKRKIISNA